MKVLASWEIAVEGASPTQDPVSGFLFLWAVSALYWQRWEDGKKPLIPEDVAVDFTGAMLQAEHFCKTYSIPVNSLVSYFGWISYKEPDSGTELTSKMEAALELIKPAIRHIQSDKNVTFDEIAALKALLAWHRTQNPTQITTARKLLGRINMPKPLLQAYTVETESQAPHLEKLKTIVKELTGKPGLTIPMEDYPKYRAEKPELWKGFLAARRAVDLIYKQQLQNYIAHFGEPQPIDDVRKHMEAQGVSHALPDPKLKGKIDAEGRIYTPDGARVFGVPSPQAKIKMNPDYDPAKDAEAGKNNNWVFKTTLPTKDAKGNFNEQYFYTEDKKKQNKSHKFDIVQQMLKVEKSMVNRWRKDLKSRDPTVAIPACQCEITYLTACRIGGRDNENKKGKTYGLTTLLVGNVKRRGDTIILDYIGKDSVHQTHKISPATPSEKEVIEILEALCHGKKRADPLFTLKSKVFGASRLRAYFAEVCPIEGATPHKIRHLRGTRLAIDQLKPVSEKLAKSRKLSQMLVDREFKAAMTKVGQLLGHVRGVETEAKATWTTAVQSYIDPGVMIEFYEQFEDQGIRVPKFLVNMGR